VTVQHSKASLIAGALFVVACIGLTGCGGGGTGPSYDSSILNPTGTPTPAIAGQDDWTTYGHDQDRSGYEATNTGITAANVSTLQLRWQLQLPSDSGIATPIAADGVVYLIDDGGDVEAVDSASGQTIWETQFGEEIRMTPTLADGLLFVGLHTYPGYVVALNASTGTEVWQQQLTGSVRGEVLIADGMAIAGMAGGDAPTYYQGGLFAYNEQTGAPQWQWLVDPMPGDGGSAWSALSFDGTNIYTGTGNDHTDPVKTSSTVAAVSLSGQLVWAAGPISNPLFDDDVGGGELLYGSNVYAASKNGNFYSIDRATGATNWSVQLSTIDGYGSIGTPATNGNVLVVGSGDMTDPDTNVDEGGTLYGISMSGSVLWTIPTEHQLHGSPALSNGIGFMCLDNKIVAFNPSTGSILWSYTGAAEFYGGPVLVPSGVYAVDEDGDVYAFGLPSTNAADRARTVALKKPTITKIPLPGRKATW
jgi:outer membrane protein assembly factor BamB